jgi:DNA-binding LacI/PurR family transcriptional regulator
LKQSGDWSAASGYDAMMSLLKSKPDIDAVFVSNDSMSLGALQAAAVFGRSVPDELAIVGFDDIPESAFFTPPLTTVRQDVLEVGCSAVSLLNQHLRSRRKELAPTDRSLIVEPELVVRQSSGRLL